MPHPFFSKPVRTIEQAVRDLLDEAKRRNDSEMYDRAIRLGIYAVTRKVTRS